MTTEYVNLFNNDNLDELKKISENYDDLSMWCGRHGQTFLHLAAKLNDVQAMKIALDKKCYKNIVDIYGATPLYYASYANNLEAVEFLINIYADPRDKSAFSGMNSCEIASDKQIKNILKKYTTEFEKILNHPVTNYYYRIALHWRYTYYFFKIKHDNSFQYFDQALKYCKENKYDEYFLLCNEKDKSYEKYIGKIYDENIDSCLICECLTDLQLCKYCKKIKICDECNKKNTISLQIHQNVCKKFFI